MSSALQVPVLESIRSRTVPLSSLYSNNVVSFRGLYHSGSLNLMLSPIPTCHFAPVNCVSFVLHIPYHILDVVAGHLSTPQRLRAFGKYFPLRVLGSND